jgi:aryl-alcohol dehydrogenase-like predicted oxidoreductase
MRTSILGSTGLTVSALGLGTVELGMPYGLGRPAPPDDDSCIRLLRHAVDRGVSFIDTAAAYGRSEELIGRAFGGSTERPVIATKVTMRDPDGAMWSGPALGEKVAASIERSLRLLQTESLDLVQIHNCDPQVAVDEDLTAAMQRHVERGEVRHWGASTYGLEAAQAVVERGAPLATLQVAYSLLDRSLEEPLFPAVHRAGLGLSLRSVFLQGVLSDRRHTLPEALTPLRDAAALAARIADDLGLSLPTVALRFALFESGAQVTLVGTAETAELDANIDAALAGPLPRDAVAALRGITVSDESLLHPGNWPAF